MKPSKRSDPPEPGESSQTFGAPRDTATPDHAATPDDTAKVKIRKHYDADFKLHAISKLLRGEKQTEVSHELGVSQPLLSIWKSRALMALQRDFEGGGSQPRGGSPKSGRAGSTGD
jgi:transposase-like protein